MLTDFQSGGDSPSFNREASEGETEIDRWILSDHEEDTEQEEVPIDDDEVGIDHWLDEDDDDSSFELGSDSESGNVKGDHVLRERYVVDEEELDPLDDIDNDMGYQGVASNPGAHISSSSTSSSTSSSSESTESHHSEPQAPPLPPVLDAPFMEKPEMWIRINPGRKFMALENLEQGPMDVDR